MKYKDLLLQATLVIPMSQTADWSIQNFNKIPQNEITFAHEKIKIQVDGSSSAVIYKLKEPVTVTGFEYTIEFQEKLNQQSTKFEEDSYFRFGLVAIGKKTINDFQKLLATDWVKKLFSLVQNEKGLDQIYFYNLAAQTALIGKNRNLTGTDLQHEEVIAARKEQPKLEIKYHLPKEKQVIALWLKSDGDDSDSKIEVQISKLILNIKNKTEVLQ